MDSRRREAKEEKREIRDCGGIGYWNKEIDPHFKFRFSAAPVGSWKHTQAECVAADMQQKGLCVPYGSGTKKPHPFIISTHHRTSWLVWKLLSSLSDREVPCHLGRNAM
jgi:hypothetical protein